MIEKNTVFIIGAGGSYPYGFPLGIELRQLAYRNAESMFQKFNAEVGDDFLADIVRVASQFSRQLKSSGDQSIDWFLKKFPLFSLVGKISILHHILQAENDSKFLEDMEDKKKQQDWYWYLYNQISKYQYDEPVPGLILRNKVSFITFNYDRSLEHFLYNRFENGHQFEKYGVTAPEIFKKIPFYHVYGKVAPLDWEREENKPWVGYGGYHQKYNLLDSLKENIKLIDEREGKKNYEIGNLLKDAERIFFLGFSYADENLTVLDIPQVLNQNQWIFGTAFGMTENEIRKIRNKFSPNVISEKMHFEDIDCLGLLRKFL